MSTHFLKVTILLVAIFLFVTTSQAQTCKIVSSKHCSIKHPVPSNIDVEEQEQLISLGLAAAKVFGGSAQCYRAIKNLGCASAYRECSEEYPEPGKPVCTELCEIAANQCKSIKEFGIECDGTEYSRTNCTSYQGSAVSAHSVTVGTTAVVSIIFTFVMSYVF